MWEEVGVDKPGTDGEDQREDDGYRRNADVMILPFLIGEFLLCDFALVFLRVFSVAFVIVVLAVFFPCDVFVGECDVPMIVVVVAIVRKGSRICLFTLPDL